MFNDSISLSLIILFPYKVGITEEYGRKDSEIYLTHPIYLTRPMERKWTRKYEGEEISL
jgi:hypothetical protein